MDQPEMEQLIRNIDVRLGRVEQFLPHVATKDDLSACATKDDLSAFATKDDLKAFATKDDLKAFATKDDLKAFATKGDLKAFATKGDLKAFASKDDLKAYPARVELEAIVATLATKDDMREEGERTRRHFDIVAERMRDDVRLALEGHGRLVERVDTLEQTTESLDHRVRVLEAGATRRKR